MFYFFPHIETNSHLFIHQETALQKKITEIKL